MKVIDLGEYRKTGYNFAESDPYEIAFMYTPDGSYVIKGMMVEVRNYMKQFPKWVAHRTFWKDGSWRGYWELSQRGVYIIKKKNTDKNRVMFNISVFRNGQLYHNIWVRRVPRRWLSIYDDAICTSKSLLRGN